MFKKSSTRLIVALVAALAVGMVAAQTAVQIADNAPDRYVVQKGDTLWFISGKFLKEPWRWPEVWRMNKDQIRNPHLIYPGNVIVLDRSGPRLALESGTTKLSPRVRQESPQQAIPSIPARAIEPWLDRPLVIEDGGLDQAPRIVATPEGRYNLGSGSRAYVSGITAGPDQLWQIYRQGAPLIDPETKKILAYEAVYLGNARVVKSGEPATIHIIQAVQEIGVGDRLLPAGKPELLSYVPHAPTSDVEARVVSIYGDRGDQGLLVAYSPALAVNRSGTDLDGYDKRREAGPLEVVAINRGRRDGLEPGHVLALYSWDDYKLDRSVGPYYLGHRAPEDVRLPVERYGLLFVFRTFDQISYGLVMRAERPLRAGDIAAKP